MIEYIYNQACSGATLDHIKNSSGWRRDTISSLILQIFEGVEGSTVINWVVTRR